MTNDIKRVMFSRCVMFSRSNNADRDSLRPENILAKVSYDMVISFLAANADKNWNISTISRSVLIWKQFYDLFEFPIYFSSDQPMQTRALNPLGKMSAEVACYWYVCLIRLLHIVKFLI